MFSTNIPLKQKYFSEFSTKSTKLKCGKLSKVDKNCVKICGNIKSGNKRLGVKITMLLFIGNINKYDVV